MNCLNRYYVRRSFSLWRFMNDENFSFRWAPLSHLFAISEIAYVSNLAGNPSAKMSITSQLFTESTQYLMYFSLLLKVKLRCFHNPLRKWTQGPIKCLIKTFYFRLNVCLEFLLFIMAGKRGSWKESIVWRFNLKGIDESFLAFRRVKKKNKKFLSSWLNDRNIWR